MAIRFIKAEDIIPPLTREIGKIAFEPDPGVLPMLQKAQAEEESELTRDILSALCKNIEIARLERIPLCQDTGTLVVFAELGIEAMIEGGTLHEILNQAMHLVHEQFYFRASMLGDSLYERQNTKDNTPVILHLEQVEGDKLKLIFGLKGGGAENMSRLKMFYPSADEREITEFVLETVKLAGSKACPPFIIGIGIGGNFESCALMAKRALFDPLDKNNPNPIYAELERTILQQVNEIGIGAMGMGGRLTALGVKIRTAPCHIASLPVGVNLQCHSHRHSEVTI